MMTKYGFTASAFLLLAGAATPALAQTAPANAPLSAEEAAALRAELSALRARVQALESKLDTATAAVPMAAPAAPVKAAPTQPEFAVKWKGAPEISNDKGWSFKPRGRLQLDVANVDGPATLSPTQRNGLGFSNKVRRAYLGLQGTIPGGFGYRFEMDVADGSATLTDAYLTYDKSGFNVTLGHHKALATLEDMTSDLDTSLIERAAFIQAFGFERRLGLSAGYAKGDWMVNAGVFTDDVRSLGTVGSNATQGGDANNSYSLDGRAVWMPKIAGTQFHLAGSLHWRDMNNLANTTSSYRARPGTRTTDVRFIGVGGLNVSSEFGAGLEALAIHGPFRATAEAFWFQPKLAASGRRADFFGAYAEGGVFLTSGDYKPYAKGAMGAVKPAHPLGAGGMGALELVLRYDYLDMTDRSVALAGGTQNGYYAGLSWTPVEHVRFMANYGHLRFSHAAIAGPGGDRNYGVDTMVGRAQFDF